MLNSNNNDRYKQQGHTVCLHSIYLMSTMGDGATHRQNKIYLYTPPFTMLKCCYFSWLLLVFALVSFAYRMVRSFSLFRSYEHTVRYLASNKTPIHSANEYVELDSMLETQFFVICLSFTNSRAEQSEEHHI